MGGLGQEATITQDASTLTITRTTQMGTFTSNYKLDGSESKNTLTIQGNSIDQVSTAKVGRRQAASQHQDGLRRQPGRGAAW